MDNQQLDMYIINRIPKRGFGFIYLYESPSGKRYIGQTIQSLHNRAKTNGKGYRNCSLFYKAIIKYGFSNFKVQILEEVEEQYLNDKEKMWIEFYNTLRPFGYNLAEGGSNGNTKKVYQYEVESGKFLKSFNSLSEAANELNLRSIQYISNCICGRNKTAHGYIWSLEKVDFVNPSILTTNASRTVYAYKLDGSFYKEFCSLTRAAEEVKGSRSDIKKCIKGEKKFSKGLIWREELQDSVEPVTTGRNGSIPVKQINLKTGEIIAIYESQSEAARALNLKNPGGISRVCKKQGKMCAGYGWEYV